MQGIGPPAPRLGRSQWRPFAGVLLFFEAR